MTNDEKLIKRFLSLVGKTPLPKFKTTEEKDLHFLFYKLPDELTVDFIINLLEDYEYSFKGKALKECKGLKGSEKIIYILDNLELARNFCKRHIK